MQLMARHNDSRISSITAVRSKVIHAVFQRNVPLESGSGIFSPVGACILVKPTENSMRYGISQYWLAPSFIFANVKTFRAVAGSVHP